MSTYTERYNRLKSFLGFTEFWLRVKVTSDHGREVNQHIIEQTRQQLGPAKRLAMSETKAKHILVAVEDGFSSDALIMSVLDRFVSQSDMILVKDYIEIAAEYADSVGCAYATYDKIPDTLNFILVFGCSDDYIMAALDKAAQLGKIAIATKAP